MNKKHLVLTHADLDGVVSAINVYNMISSKSYNFQYIVTGYNSLDKKLKNLNREEYDILWITDLNLSKDNIKYLPTDKHIIWIDHHSYEYDVYEATKHLNIKIIHKKDDSSSMISFEYINEHYKLSNNVYNLSLYADTYDTWKLTSKIWKQAYALNDLFWHYGYEKFFVNFRNGLYFKNEDLSAIEDVNKQRNEYIKDTLEKYIIFNEKFKIIYILNPQCKYINHFPLGLYDVDHFIIMKSFDKKSFSYSVRLYNSCPDLTVNNLFDKVKEQGVNVLISGGNSRVGSITVSYEDNEKFLEVLNNILEGELTNAK